MEWLIILCQEERKRGDFHDGGMGFFWESTGPCQELPELERRCREQGRRLGNGRLGITWGLDEENNKKNKERGWSKESASGLKDCCYTTGSPDTGHRLICTSKKLYQFKMHMPYVTHSASCVCMCHIIFGNVSSNTGLKLRSCIPGCWVGKYEVSNSFCHLTSLWLYKQNQKW